MELQLTIQQKNKGKIVILASVRQHEVITFAEWQQKPMNDSHKIEVLEINCPKALEETSDNIDSSHGSTEPQTNCRQAFTPNDYESKLIDLEPVSVEYDLIWNPVENPSANALPMEDLVACGRKIASVRDRTRSEVLKGCRNRFYAGGVSRNTVREPISLNLLRRVERSLHRHRAERFCRVRSRKEQDPRYTQLQSSAFLAFVHRSQVSDIMDIEGFIPARDYTHRDPISKLELGCIDDIVFLTSAQLEPIYSAGANTAGTGLISSNDKSVDIFQILVVGKRAWTGASLDDPKHLDLDFRTKGLNAPGRMNYQLVATYRDRVFIQNHNWITVIETGVVHRQ